MSVQAFVERTEASLAFAYEALPGRVVFGTGIAEGAIAAELDRLGARRVMLVVAGPELDLGERLTEPLGKRVVATFTGVRQHVPVEVARAARRQAIDAGAEALVSVGGGSTTGTAKAVSLETGTPIVAVPTTYAGSEMTPVWGMTEAHRKTTGRAAAVLPRAVVYDPELTVSLPAAVSGPSAINALAHCVEALYAPAANPITSLFALEGACALAAGAPRVVAAPDDIAARSSTLYGAYLAGAAFAVAGGGLHHRICHVLGGALDLPHAETHTIVLPHVAAYFTPAVPRTFAALSEAIRAPSAAAGLFDLATRVGAPTALREVGLGDDRLEEAIDRVVAELPQENPRPVDRDAVRVILTAAQRGERPQESA